MSLWKKWEKEKLKRMGIRIERQKDDVRILDTRLKSDARKQLPTLILVVLTCFVIVFIGWTLRERHANCWSDFPVIQYMAGMIERRMDEGRSFR